ncbi:MAG: HAD hydrolase-like protein [Bacteroidia bacterium]|nr:HAD hydrolase-like protein [Bacteroidia bacterium]
MKFKNLFFDFDGVIAESVSCKTQAFREIYLPYGEEIASKVVSHHIHNGGVSRFEKFKIYHKEFLGETIDEKKVQELANLFSDLVLTKVITSNEVNGATTFIKKYSKSHKLWIITGTPTDEIIKITEARGIEDYFVGIHGSPENKRFWTEFLIKKHNLNREETLFLGDATTDFDAAQFSNLHFALRTHDENIDIFNKYNGLRFSDFNELENKIKAHL